MRVFILVISVGLLSIGGCDSDGSGSDSGKQGPESAPTGVSFSTLEHEFGRITDEESPTADITIRNDSESAVNVVEVRPLCSCLTPTLEERVIPAGGTVALRVQFNSKMQQGKVRKAVLVRTDHPSAKETSIYFSVFVNPWVRREPMGISFGELRRGERPEPKEVRIAGRRPGFKVTKVTSTHPNFHVTRASEREVDFDGETRREFVYRVVFGGGESVERSDGQLIFETNDPVSPRVICSVTGAVVGPLRVVPDRVVALTRPANGAFRQSVTFMHREKKPFEILSARIVGECEFTVEADPSRSAPDRAVWSVSGRGPAKVAERIEVEIHFDTSLQDQPRVVVPLTVLRPRN